MKKAKIYRITNNFLIQHPLKIFLLILTVITSLQFILIGNEEEMALIFFFKKFPPKLIYLINVLTFAFFYSVYVEEIKDYKNQFLKWTIFEDLFHLIFFCLSPITIFFTSCVVLFFLDYNYFDEFWNNSIILLIMFSKLILAYIFILKIIIPTILILKNLILKKNENS